MSESLDTWGLLVLILNLSHIVHFFVVENCPSKNFLL